LFDEKISHTLEAKFRKPTRSCCSVILLSTKMMTPLGNDDQAIIIEASHGIGGALTGSLVVAVVDRKGGKSAPDCMAISADNIVGVEMGDLSEKDRNDLELELQ
jgi:hypothetical protein